VRRKREQSHSRSGTGRRAEALAKRVQGLKREFFESDQAAIAELLQASIGNGERYHSGDGKRTSPHYPKSGAQPEYLQKQLGRTTRIGRGKTRTGRDARPASQNGGLTWVDMIAGVLKRHRGLSLRELITALDREFGWKYTELQRPAALGCPL